ncbi:Cleavage and polyadenylation specificity factor cpsf30-like, partial [Globisporangium splendens]
MVLGLLLRDDEERALAFDFEALLPDDANDAADDDKMDGSGGGAPGGKKDFKRGTVVCRHWLRALCMKGDNCEFLHQLAREECPETADFSLQSKVADEENVKRRKAQPVNEFYKIAICKHWEKQGSCPFGDECHFAHGEKELRPFPKGEKDPKEAQMGGKPGGPGGDHGPRGGGAGPGFPAADRSPPPPVVLPDENKLCKYFLLQSQSYHNLASSVHHNQWTAPKEIQKQLKFASETCDEVFLLITVGPSKHFQGVARIPSGVLVNAGTEEGEDLSAGVVPYQSEGKTQWSGAFAIEWLRICECPWERLAQFENKHLPVPECPNGQELDAEMGHSLVRLLFNQAQIQLHYKSVEDEQELPGGAEELAVRRREAAESVFGGPGAGFGVPAPRWKVSMPGFVFACNNTTIDECFGRMIFGLAKDQEQMALKHVVPGAPLFLLNMSDRHVLGIFEAVSPVVMNMAPGAFSHAAHVPSPFPVQTRFAVMLNAPAINTADPQIKQIVGERGIRIGPLTLQITQRLADVFAERCGAVFPPPKQLPGMGMAAHMGNPDPSFRAPNGAPKTASTGGGVKDPNAPALLEKLVVGIENDNEFSVTRRIIGHAGSNMKRISSEASGNAKIRVRGRGSGSKEGGQEEANEPLMILVSAENERSFRIAVDLTNELLANIHHEYRMFLAQKSQQQQHHRQGPPVAHFHGFPRGPPHQFHGPQGVFGGPPPHAGGGGFPMMRGGPPGQFNGHQQQQQEPK